MTLHMFITIAACGLFAGGVTFGAYVVFSGILARSRKAPQFPSVILPTPRQYNEIGRSLKSQIARRVR